MMSGESGAVCCYEKKKEKGKESMVGWRDQEQPLLPELLL